MNFNRLTIWIAVISTIILIIGVFSAWFFFFRSTTTLSTDTATTGSFFGTDSPNTNTANTTTNTSNGTQAVNTTVTSNQQKVFKISDGPIVGATLIQTLRPTTTIARYIRQDDGHVFDIPLGVAGAVPKVVSNVTIPGGSRAIWLEGGRAAIMQYVDDSSVIKTVYLGFPVATTTTLATTRIQFLPDNIIDIAASPDGKSVAYLLKTAKGSDGYIANSDGLNSKKTFTLPLSQLLVSWPSPNTLLVQTKSVTGSMGIAFSVDIKSGGVYSLVSAFGITATVNSLFSHVVYSKSDNNTTRTYVHDVKNGTDKIVQFNPIPEKCIWSKVNNTTMYCAYPIQPTPTNYLDLWHMGAMGYADFISNFDVINGTSMAIASPGSTDGGNQANILEMSLSPDENYLSYTTKGDRTLWGVLLRK